MEPKKNSEAPGNPEKEEGDIMNPQEGAKDDS